MCSGSRRNEEDPRAYLETLILHGMKLGLQNISTLMDACGRPHLARPVVHVAGTNGKGSVLTFLSAILNAAGYRTGRFTSPHLLDVTERFLLDDQPMCEEDLRENVSFFKQLSEETGCTPTFFEMTTAVAFRWFARRAVDVALVEVGMGGRFDSTNIVEPLACAITNIDFDHTQFLGDSRAAIAFEKAGILKAGVPAVIGVTDREPLQVIQEQGRVREASLHCLDHEFSYAAAGTVWQPLLAYRGFGEEFTGLAPGLAGGHQAHNASIAVSLAMLLRGHFPRITEKEIREGLRAARWPGRLERVLDDPPVIMDVAHNPAGCATLAKTFDRCVTVFSVSSDKDAAEMIHHLARFSDPLILTEYQGGRTMPLEALQKCAEGHAFIAHPDLHSALEAGMGLAGKDKPLLVTGSIYAAGEARRILMDRYGATPVTFG